MLSVQRLAFEIFTHKPTHFQKENFRNSLFAPFIYLNIIKLDRKLPTLVEHNSQLKGNLTFTSLSINVQQDTTFMKI